MHLVFKSLHSKMHPGCKQLYCEYLLTSIAGGALGLAAGGLTGAAIGGIAGGKGKGATLLGIGAIACGA